MKGQEYHPTLWSARGPAPLWPAAAWRRFRTNLQPTRTATGRRGPKRRLVGALQGVADSRPWKIPYSGSVAGWHSFPDPDSDNGANVWTNWKVCPTRSLPPPQPGCPAGDPGPLTVLIPII